MFGKVWTSVSKSVGEKLGGAVEHSGKALGNVSASTGKQLGDAAQYATSPEGKKAIGRGAVVVGKVVATAAIRGALGVDDFGSNSNDL